MTFSARSDQWFPLYSPGQLFGSAEKCTVKYNRIFRNATGCYPRLGIRDVDVLWRWPSILGSPVNDRCVPAAAVTWQALIGGPAQLAGVLAWLLCHGRQSASLSLAEGARESFVVVG